MGDTWDELREILRHGGERKYIPSIFLFVVRCIIGKIMKDLLGVGLITRNGSIWDIPSFPYGWCLPKFIGEDSNMLLWDYSMNEGNIYQGFEA